MKRLIGIITVILFFSGFANAVDFMIELRAHYFSPSEQIFRDIYGGGVMYGGEVSIEFWKNLQFWLGGNYYSGDGELTFTKEETSLQIIPIGGGLRYKLPVEIFSFHVGVGINYNLYKESNILGEVNEGGIGYVGKIGVMIKVVKGLIFDMFGEYSYCKMTPADFTINIGGIAAGIGLGYIF